MDTTRWPAIAGLIAGTFYLSSSATTTFAFDKPLLTAILCLASSGTIVLLYSRYLPRDGSRTIQGQLYEAMSLEEVGPDNGEGDISPEPADIKRPTTSRGLRIAFVALVGAICLRILLSIRILANIQCASLSWEPFIPFVFACWDYRKFHRYKRDLSYDKPDGSMYDALEHNILGKRYIHLIVVGLVSFGSMIATANTRYPASTYICSTHLSLHSLLPFFQVIVALADVAIVYCITHISQHQDGNSIRSPRSRFWSIGMALVSSAAFLTVASSLSWIAFAIKFSRQPIPNLSGPYTWSIIKLDIAVCVIALSALILMSISGPTSVTLICIFVPTCVITTAYSWSTHLAFPLTQHGIGLVSLLIATLGVGVYFYIDSSLGENNLSTRRPLFAKSPIWLYVLLCTLLFFRTVHWASSSSGIVAYHPIDLLMYDAQGIHAIYANQTKTSGTLAEAVATYRKRYSRHPPPGFQHWYDFATARNSSIIDNFDSIYHDLSPFQAVSPAELRERTWQLASNPWHRVAGLTVRDGKVKMSHFVDDPHRWMVSGVVKMIRQFSEYLPDMDIAINMGDEARVAAPFEQLQRQKLAAAQLHVHPQPDPALSKNRAEQWKPIPKEPNEDAVLIDRARQESFYTFGSIGCPPGSPARGQRLWNVRQHCASCNAPQSIGAFLSNWTLAADPCHQPDLARLHGYYLSPSTFKSTHELYPVFSQSKPNGFNDILYPSAWNYVDKVRYHPSEEHPEPTWQNKNNSILWRGSYTEGTSNGLSQWKGMSRQRFVHLANEPHGSQASQTILLPLQHQEGEDSKQKFKYTSVSVSDLTKFIKTDVHFSSKVSHCGGIDCDQQEKEFGPKAERVHFQEHWKHKYLLDMDGAGFSGRFISFMQSHSLPMKTALFREWWDDRLTAWHHFVPLDLRGHGFWATLFYFTGFDGKLNGKDVKVEAHDKEAERIAENGREWANEVLRKEDMEIYMFRLLLEWARLTDDKRNDLGYDVDVG